MDWVCLTSKNRLLKEPKACILHLSLMLVGHLGLCYFSPEVAYLLT